MGGVVDQQLSRDLVLLDDLRGTLNHVMAWDHTQGGPDPAAGGGSGGANQEKGIIAHPPPADASATAADQHTTSKTSSLSKGSGGAANTSGGREQEDGRSSGEERSSAGKDGLMEHIPLALGRRAESGHHRDGETEATDGEIEESGPSRGARDSTAPPHRSSGEGTSSIAARTVSSDDAGSTTTSTTSVSNGGCSEWLSKRQKRTAPTPLTDDERMSLLQHVRPSVFGGPAVLNHQRRKAVVYGRPRSAAAAAGGGGSHSFHLNRHDPPRATTARRRSREGEQLGGSDASGRRPRASGCSSSAGASKHRGILVHDGWVAGEGGPPSGSLSASTGDVHASSPRGGRLRPSVGFGGPGGGGSARQVSLVNSVAFEVNMGVLDALSDTAASATAASAFASAAAGEATTTAKSVMSATSTICPWLSSEEERKRSGYRQSDVPRGQSAPLTGRRKRYI